MTKKYVERAINVQISNNSKLCQHNREETFICSTIHLNLVESIPMSYKPVTYKTYKFTKFNVREIYTKLLPIT